MTILNGLWSGSVKGSRQKPLFGRLSDLLEGVTPESRVGTAPAVSRPGLGCHVPALDGVRGLAILLVMVLHFGYWCEPRAVGGPAHAYLCLIRTGWIGVDLFFVLSGFLISGILLDTRDSSRYFPSFFMRRTLRVWPLYYGVLIVVFLFGPLLGISNLEGIKDLRANQLWLWSYMTNIGMCYYEIGAHVFYAGWLELGHFWSLAVEEHFYLVWPFVVLFVARRWLAAVCVVGILASMALRYELLRVGSLEVAIYVLTPCRMDALFMGSLLAVLVRRPGGPAALLAPARCLIIFAMLALVVVVKHDNVWMDQYGWRMQQFGYSAIAVAFGSLLILALNARPGGPWHRLWTSGPLRALGRYSYGLYVYHGFFGVWLTKKLILLCAGPGARTSLPSILAISATSIAVTLLVAVASYHLLEMPFLRLKRYFAP